jgi:hypothetical protein
MPFLNISTGHLELSVSPFHNRLLEVYKLLSYNANIIETEEKTISHHSRQLNIAYEAYFIKQLELNLKKYITHCQYETTGQRP